MLDAARWAGSARNRQPWRFAVVRDAGLRAELAGLGAYAHHLADAPVVILLALDVAGGGADAEFDGGRAAQNLLLAADALGLAACPVTFFPAANVARATAIAQLPSPPWRVRTAIALGWPGADAPTGQRSVLPRGRRPLSELRQDVTPNA